MRQAVRRLRNDRTEAEIFARLTAQFPELDDTRLWAAADGAELRLPAAPPASDDSHADDTASGPTPRHYHRA